MPGGPDGGLVLGRGQCACAARRCVCVVAWAAQVCRAHAWRGRTPRNWLADDAQQRRQRAGLARRPPAPWWWGAAVWGAGVTSGAGLVQTPHHTRCCCWQVARGRAVPLARRGRGGWAFAAAACVAHGRRSPGVCVHSGCNWWGRAALPSTGRTHARPPLIEGGSRQANRGARLAAAGRACFTDHKRSSPLAPPPKTTQNSQRAHRAALPVGTTSGATAPVRPRRVQGAGGEAAGAADLQVQLPLHPAPLPPPSSPTLPSTPCIPRRRLPGHAASQPPRPPAPRKWRTSPTRCWPR